jgi:hypothetical protein
MKLNDQLGVIRGGVNNPCPVCLLLWNVRTRFVDDVTLQQLPTSITLSCTVQSNTTYFVLYIITSLLILRSGLIRRSHYGSK